jgi:hypothetical protein
MKEKIVGTCICMLMIVAVGLPAVGTMNGKIPLDDIAHIGTQTIQNAFVQPCADLHRCNTLISESNNNRVIEVDTNGTIVWEKDGLNAPADADRLPNGNTLITSVLGGVIEVNKSGAIIWNYSMIYGPTQADRLANGNTLIAGMYSGGVYEVNTSGVVVWSIENLNYPVSTERLLNGNTLVTEFMTTMMGNGRIIEINNTGAIQWQYTTSGIVIDAHRLANGNTLISDTGNNRVIEVDHSGIITWEKDDVNAPSRVQRLANGNTLIAQYTDGKVIEVSPNGSVVWQLTGLNWPIDAERLEPVLNVTLSKGLGITAHIENIGNANASNIQVTITVTGGFILWGKTITNSLGNLPVGSTDTTKFFLIGFGKISVFILVTCDEGSEGKGNTNGVLLLLYIF